MIEVALATTSTLVAATPSIVTVVPARKPAPVSVTAVPPAVVPLFGEIAVTVGGDAGAAVTTIVAVPGPTMKLKSGAAAAGEVASVSCPEVKSAADRSNVQSR